MTRSLAETVPAAAQAAVRGADFERDQEAWNLPRPPEGERGTVRLVRGRFEAQFPGFDAARAAARDASAVGFAVDVREHATGWLAVGRRGLPFPDDERDRYASRFHSIATRHGGAFRRFVREDTDGE